MTKGTEQTKFEKSMEQQAFKILVQGNPREIKSWIIDDFHRVQHTQAFLILVERLDFYINASNGLQSENTQLREQIVRMKTEKP